MIFLIRNIRMRNIRVRFLIKIILFGLIATHGYSFFEMSLELEKMCQEYIQAITSSSSQPNQDQNNQTHPNRKKFFALLRNTKNPEQLANLALFSSVLGAQISQEEIDNLWITTQYNSISMNFYKAFGIYICGRIIGLSILNNYNQLNAGRLQGEVNFDWNISEQTWLQNVQPLLDQLFTKSADKNYVTKQVGSFQTLSQYQDFINQTIASYRNNPEEIYQYINPHNPANNMSWKDIVKQFEMLVASEYCILWLNQYAPSNATSNSTLNLQKSRQTFESKLSKVSTETLILSAQRILAQYSPNPFPQVIVAYTVANKKDQSHQEKLDALVKTLIQNRKVQAFEPLLLPQTQLQNKAQTSKK